MTGRETGPSSVRDLDRQGRGDDDANGLPRPAKGLLHAGRVVAEREDESEVRAALGKRRSSYPSLTVTDTSQIPGIRLAAITPSTRRSVPAPGVGIISTPAARPESRNATSGARPSARCSTRCSRLVPDPNVNSRAQSPPMVRAAISMIHASPSWRRSSACTGPSVSPYAAQPARTRSAASVWTGRGSREGVT